MKYTNHLLSFLFVLICLHSSAQTDDWKHIKEASGTIPHVELYYRFDANNLVSIKAVNDDDIDWSFTVGVDLYDANDEHFDTTMGECWADAKDEMVHTEVNLETIEDMEERNFLAASGFHIWEARTTKTKRVEIQLFNIYGVDKDGEMIFVE